MPSACTVRQEPKKEFSHISSSQFCPFRQLWRQERFRAMQRHGVSASSASLSLPFMLSRSVSAHKGSCSARCGRGIGMCACSASPANTPRRQACR